eukprot:TRINITY_DN104441_c0_g1_i1.p1 TRINITY_DN104441_c0_g1~~TRINITY_DN104441_c0_g1_i1.p1  ORF type:complete len:257 (+),score=-4.98 TRINITY_DN104441_c0_g1_i1:31-801(+)
MQKQMDVCIVLDSFPYRKGKENVLNDLLNAWGAGEQLLTLMVPSDTRTAAALKDNWDYLKDKHFKRPKVVIIGHGDFNGLASAEYNIKLATADLIDCVVNLLNPSCIAFVACNIGRCRLSSLTYLAPAHPEILFIGIDHSRFLPNAKGLPHKLSSRICENNSMPTTIHPNLRTSLTTVHLSASTTNTLTVAARSATVTSYGMRYRTNTGTSSTLLSSGTGGCGKKQANQCEFKQSLLTYRTRNLTRYLNMPPTYSR